MKNNILPAIKLTLVSLVFFCGIYVAIILGVAQITPGGGKGAKTIHNGNVYYSNIGQGFTSDKYFSSRPSAVDYNGAGSGGSNKGPTNPEYLSQVQSRIDTFMIKNPEVKKEEIPSDIVTASGSGLDPNISVQAARIQVKRISKIRNLKESVIEDLIEKNINEPILYLFGPRSINLLNLNIALDEATKG